LVPRIGYGDIDNFRMRVTCDREREPVTSNVTSWGRLGRSDEQLLSHLPWLARERVAKLRIAIEKRLTEGQGARHQSEQHRHNCEAENLVTHPFGLCQANNRLKQTARGKSGAESLRRTRAAA